MRIPQVDIFALLLLVAFWPRSIEAYDLDDTNATEGTMMHNDNNETINDNSEEIEQVECSDDQKVFVAATEFILEGRNDLFNGVERTALQAAFLEIYNLLTRDACDSYFRKIQDMEFIAMTNFLNETITFEDAELLSILDGAGRPEGPPPDGPPSEGPPNQPSFLENATNATFSFDDDGDFIPPPPIPGEGLPEGLPDVETLGNLTPCELLNEVLPEEGPDGLPTLPENGLPCEIIEDVLPPPPTLPENPPTLPENPPILPENPPPLPGGGPPRPPGPFGRKLRRRLEETYDATAINSTEGVAITYEVTGSCRDCPVSNTGSFALFDDAFRLRMRFRILEVRSASKEEIERSLQGPPLPILPPPPPILPPPATGDSQPDDSGPPEDGGPPGGGPPEDGGPPAFGAENNDDCTCSAGLAPDLPQAPTIEDLLVFLNERLVELQEEQGILEDLVFQDLMQLDDYQSLVNTENTNVAILSAEESTKSSNFGLMQAITKDYPKGKSTSSSLSSKSMEQKLDETAFMTTSAGMARSIQTPIMLLLVLAALR